MVRAEEVTIYQRADVVIVVSDEDGKLLATEVPDTRIATIPNIHVIHSPVARIAEPVLTFVGGFAHEPNADAVLYFCRQILPLIETEIPEVIFNVIGNAPPPEVQALASDRIRVMGYVPDTLPYLGSTLISVAPLRYGAGMKGKVGEAMSLGLPVVTTSVGAEGFGLTPGENVLVGDTPTEFAQHVIRLIRDREFCDQIRMGGYNLIREKYSDRVVMQQVVELFQSLHTLAVKSLPFHRVLARRMNALLHDHLLWRFRRGA
jgi:glycosyltransferase involved in cell wall biosynthesis